MCHQSLAWFPLLAATRFAHVGRRCYYIRSTLSLEVPQPSLFKLPFFLCTCLAKSHRLLFLMILLLLVHRAPRGLLRRPGFRSQNGLPGLLLLLLFRDLFCCSQHDQHATVSAVRSQPQGQPRTDALSTTVSHHTEVWPACTAWSPVVLCKLLTPARTHLACRPLREGNGREAQGLIATAWDGRLLGHQSDA